MDLVTLALAKSYINKRIGEEGIVTGATPQQAAQIEQNKNDIANLQTEIEDKQPKGDYVKTVNGNKPDANGNVVVETDGNDSGENATCYPDWSHLKAYVMGDSLTDPAGGTHTSKFYYEYIQEKTGIQVVVDGIGGTGYHAGASTGTRFADRVKNIPADVDIVTIFGSGNDVVYATKEQYHAAMAEAMAYFFENRPGLPVIIVPPSPWATYSKRSDEWKNYCDTMELVAMNYSLHYVRKMWSEPPFDPNSPADRAAFFTKCPDGVHPDENGHRLLAPYFYNAMLEVLAFEGKCQAGNGENANGGLNDTAQNLLITILRSGVYSTDQSDNITALEAALSVSGGTEDPDDPETPESGVIDSGRTLVITGGVTVTEDGDTLRFA